MLPSAVAHATHGRHAIAKVAGLVEGDVPAVTANLPHTPSAAALARGAGSDPLPEPGARCDNDYIIHWHWPTSQVGAGREGNRIHRGRPEWPTRGSPIRRVASTCHQRMAYYFACRRPWRRTPPGPRRDAWTPLGAGDYP